ncbi:glycosyltransferase family 2 protein [Janthinobacterium fluminis]|uniref:Glycosyltransferase family 2 protein n=1 Tax=Janthinobacterium fluminis TaxID=2987524 RepID=A0ABT5K767_9BURK|nr:glycosyltransferase family 2 protein [Janthinobacterium fluminis]MDC8760847.1 glycosyltransferase family 2 protein [Janthinobacterium fluminis]
MNSSLKADHHIAVVIPSFKVTKFIVDVIEKMGPEVSSIFVIDDCCPDKSGDFVEANISDPRVKVIRHTENQGVGGAVITGYRAAIGAGADIIVKVDGDGQMDPKLIPLFIAPIVSQDADYTKGNRFYDIIELHRMPRLRLVMNAALSMLNKLSSGYWNVFDPTNGFTAIHAGVARLLPFEKINKRYFFETDMLFRLNLIRAVVVDVPMDAVYGDEVSNIRYTRALWDFSRGHLRNFVKRIGYNYFLRDMSAASFELFIGIPLMLFGFGFGLRSWWLSITAGAPSTPGTVMLAGLPVIIGLQLLLSFISYDVSSLPTRPRQKTLRTSPSK